MSAKDNVGVGGSDGSTAGPSKKKGNGVNKQDYRKGQTLKKYTIEDKTKIMKLLDDGMKICEIHHLTGFQQSTIRTMKGKETEIKKSLSLAKKLFASNPSSQRRLTSTYSEGNRLIAMTEYYVEKWLSRRAKEGASVNGPQVREQARILFAAIVAKKKIKNPPEFNASVGWLAKFKKRCGVKYAKYQGELASADSQASSEFPSFAKQIIADGGYSPDQIYNCDETGLYWKRAPKGTFIAKSEKQAPRVKMAKDRFSILFTCNASGSHRMKPLVIHKYQKPHAYKNCNMKKLNVDWQSNKSGYMKAALSIEWFDTCFVPDARRKCKELNLDFKVVLFMDNAPGHAKFLVGRHPNVLVVFLPPNTTSKLQPLDQELIANIKILYYKYVHDKMRGETDTDTEVKEIMQASESESEPDEPPETDAQTKETPTTIAQTADDPAQNAEVKYVKLFWKKFNIKQAVDFMVQAWNNLTPATIKHAWENLLPVAKQPQEVQQQVQRQSDLADALQSIRTVPAPGFGEVSEVAVLEELIQSSEKSMEQLIAEELEDEDDDMNDQQQTLPPPAPPLTVQQLSEALALITQTREILEGKADSELAQEAVENLNSVLMDMYNKKANDQQQSLITKFFNQQKLVANAIENISVEDNTEIVNTVDMDMDIDLDEYGFIGFETAAIGGSVGAVQVVQVRKRRVGYGNSLICLGIPQSTP